MALQNEGQGKEFINRMIHELESDLDLKLAEAKEKGWYSDGKKYQAINEIERHIWSLKELRTFFTE